ncbi:FAD-dependent oxidoreductase [Janthinobacterium sp. BJB401]|uniref:flavin monoamine oxidase family protein n=1 Tax=Janthinobacterium sp. BJB401 TaxID=2745934 RepID=UPI00130524F8|nr:FAD-dependent oxidoreductase [Janthinobacterium sp. BJB401]NVI81608.1 FAD-dependent oxidoreductase [Janthinobacterium sp. BJB401]
MQTSSDICIIGGGISGLYLALRLKRSAPQLRIQLFEALEAVGGRVQTEPMLSGQFRAEFGAVRIEPDLQPLMDQFVQQLGIATSAITSHEACSAIRPDLTRLTPAERAVAEQAAGGDVAWALLWHGIAQVIGAQWPLASDHLERPARAEEKASFRRLAQFGGRPLYQQGMWNVLSEVLSHEAVEFTREKGAFYNFKNQNPNAADWICQLLDMRLMQRPSYIPQGGMQALIDAAEQAVRAAGVDIHVRHQLLAFGERADGALDLQLLHDGERVTLRTRRLILALPRSALEALAPSLPAPVQASLDAVLCFPIVWASCVMADPWWSPGTPPGSGEGATTRAAHFESHPEQPEAYGLAMFYNDDPWCHYWANLTDTPGARFPHKGRPVHSSDERLRQALVRTLQQTFGRDDEPQLLEWGLCDWSAAPFGAGVHFWKPGRDSEQVMRTLAAFALGDDGRAPQVHICGEAYSDFQGFFEGALRSAQRVLQALPAYATSSHQGSDHECH